MKSLVVYYSRTGTNKKAASSIARLLKADTEELVDFKKRGGILGYLISGFDAVRKKQTQINPVKKDSSKYGLVILGTPIWAGDMAPAIRTYLTQNNGKIKKIAFFCTKGGGSINKALADTELISGKKILAVLDLTEREVTKGDYTGKVKEFTSKLK